ncbi:hypothetical protein MTR67_033852 [Solanum verrucosum]|uniref:Protein SirB1 N-terminal domain-containing protein n=1 Tax=Solanum verrucosum TaxID=315347 RepID=A0AAF0U754_SOLVR|nr:hypothetical protein MTR67_033852 [Solanum verrucosum]
MLFNLCTTILLSVIYIEVCRRLNLTIVGSRIGEEFLIWPQTGNPEELFKVTSGHSLFGIVNGKCVYDPRSMASDINSNSLSELEIATNRDIIGIALANLMRIHWKRASRANHGLMLTSPLRSVDKSDEKFKKTDASTVPLLRPQDLRFKMLICNIWHEKRRTVNNFGYIIILIDSNFLQEKKQNLIYYAAILHEF